MSTFPFLSLPVLAFLATLVLGLVLDKEVGAALLLLAVLSMATFFTMRRFGIRQREVYLLFTFVLVSHAAFVLFVHYTGFQPFGTGGGDFIRYDAVGKEVAERVRVLNFSLEGIWKPHYFPVMVGYLYAVVAPAMVVGQMFLVWTAALSVLVLYFLVVEIGGSRIWAFLAAGIASIYPSFLFFTSYLLKDGLVILLVLLSLFILVKLLKRFSWKKYAVLFLLALPLANLRSEFYDVFAISFFISWFAFSKMQASRRVVLGIVLFSLYGFAPFVTTQGGYYDYKTFQSDVNLKKVINLKERVYLALPPSLPQPEPVPPSLPQPEPAQRESGHVDTRQEKKQTDSAAQEPLEMQQGRGSTVADLQAGEESIGSFVWNQARAFAFVLLGPFPWQFSSPRHAVTLVETIPWLVLFVFIIRGIWRQFREDKRAPVFALLVFALGVFVVLALFINNFGITMRIRIPGVLALLPFLPLAFQGTYPPFSNAVFSRLPRRLLSNFGLADWGGRAMKEVFRVLERHGVRTGSLRALDMFAGDGMMQTRAYAGRIASLQAWELDPILAAALKKNIPTAGVKITNSMEEMKRPQHQGSFDLVVIDNHTMCYGPQEKYCEHFDVLPDALSLLNPKEGIVVFNVNREPPGIVATKTHQERKALFYNIAQTEKRHLDLGFLQDFYTALFEKKGYRTRFFFSVSRGGAHRQDYLHYFVYGLEKA